MRFPWLMKRRRSESFPRSLTRSPRLCGEQPHLIIFGGPRGHPIEVGDKSHKITQRLRRITMDAGEKYVVSKYEERKEHNNMKSWFLIMACIIFATISNGALCGSSEPLKPQALPLIGEKAPQFIAETTQGKINFPDDYKGKWVILFSHPADFTPVCTTEFMTFAAMMPEFEALNCKLVGLSIDSLYSHIAWLRTIKEKIEFNGMKNIEVTFPLIEDLKMEVSKKYGMLQPSASDTKAVRAVFYIDPESTIRAILYYPLSNGRNFQEIKRLLIAMQTSDAHKVATPADWKPGQPVIVPPPGSCGAAKDRTETREKDVKCHDWFFCLKNLPIQDSAAGVKK